MPKENIDDLISKGWRTEVSWSPGNWVQLATVNTDSGMTLPGEPGDPPQKFDGWHVTHDRAAINRVIRALRKARDAAFGADE